GVSFTGLPRTRRTRPARCYEPPWSATSRFSDLTERLEDRSMAQAAKPAEGSWTEHYPELGTGLVSYEDSTSPEFYELEGEAIYKRVWLNVGRVEQLPRNGSFFTKDIRIAKSSVIIV